MTLEIRLAESGDANSIAAIGRAAYALSFGSSLSNADLIEILERDYSKLSVSAAIAGDSVLLAESDGVVVGFAQVGASDSVLSRWAPIELRRLYVLPEHQNRGAGGALVEALLRRFAVNAESAIVLDVWDRNEGARRLYERYGFETVGEKEFFASSESQTSPDLVMVRCGRFEIGPEKSPAV